MSIQPPSGPVTLFYSYAHEDEELRNQLDKHLRLLERRGLITSWHDREIHAGDDWAQKIDTYLENAQIILLLISADFLASDYCYDVELQRALERHSIGEAHVIPIILRPVDWKQDLTLSSLQALPTDGKPITTWPSPPYYDEAFEDIAQGIRQVVENLLNGQYKPEQKGLAKTGITNQHLQEQRKENLWMRLKMGFNSREHMKRIKAQFQSIQNKLILAGSELSIDPNGKGVMDAFVAYMQAQARYIQEIIRPMKSPLTFAFGKTDTAVLDELAKQADEQLSILEKVAQDFIQSS